MSNLASYSAIFTRSLPLDELTQLPIKRYANLFAPHVFSTSNTCENMRGICLRVNAP
jgi:hypothetical protein